jgi:hypothetical protein
MVFGKRFFCPKCPTNFERRADLDGHVWICHSAGANENAALQYGFHDQDQWD